MQLVRAENHLGKLTVEWEFPGCAAQVCLPRALLVGVPVPHSTPQKES